MKDLKTLLLSPENSAIPMTLFGTGLHIRRISAFELAEFEEQNGRLRDGGDSRSLAILSAGLVLSAIVDESGKPVQNLPAPEELIKAHSPAALVNALTTVQRHSYGTLEEAKKN